MDVTPPSRKRGSNSLPESHHDAAGSKRQATDRANRSLDSHSVTESHLTTPDVEEVADTSPIQARSVGVAERRVDPGLSIHLTNFSNTCFLNTSVYLLEQMLPDPLPDEIWLRAQVDHAGQQLAISLVNLLMYQRSCKSGREQETPAKTNELQLAFMHACRTCGNQPLPTHYELHYPPCSSPSVGEVARIQATTTNNHYLVARLGELFQTSRRRFDFQRGFPLDQQDPCELMNCIVDLLGLKGGIHHGFEMRKQISLDYEGGHYCKNTRWEPELFIPLTLGDADDLDACIGANSQGEVEVRWSSEDDQVSVSGSPSGTFPPGNQISAFIQQYRLLSNDSPLVFQLQCFDFLSGRARYSTKARQMLLATPEKVRIPITGESTAGQPFQLQQVIVHLGNSLDSGHFILLEKAADGWQIINDLDKSFHRVDSLIEALARTGTPYLLLYQPVDEPMETVEQAQAAPAPVSPLVEEPPSMLTEPQALIPELYDDYQVPPTPGTLPPLNGNTLKLLQRMDFHFYRFLNDESSVGTCPIPTLSELRTDLEGWSLSLARYLCNQYDIVPRGPLVKANLSSHDVLWVVKPNSIPYCEALKHFMLHHWNETRSVSQVCRQLIIYNIEIPPLGDMTREQQGTCKWTVSLTQQVMELLLPQLADSLNAPPEVVEFADAIKKGLTPKALVIRRRREAEQQPGAGFTVPRLKPFREHFEQWNDHMVRFITHQYREQIEEQTGAPLPDNWRLNDFDKLKLLKPESRDYQKALTRFMSDLATQGKDVYQIQFLLNLYDIPVPPVQGRKSGKAKTQWSQETLTTVATRLRVSLPDVSPSLADHVRDNNFAPGFQVYGLVGRLNKFARIREALRPPVNPNMRDYLTEWTPPLLRVVYDELYHDDPESLDTSLRVLPIDYLCVYKPDAEQYSINMKRFIEKELSDNPTVTATALLDKLNRLARNRSETVPVPDDSRLSPGIRGTFPWSREAFTEVCNAYEIPLQRANHQHVVGDIVNNHMAKPGQLVNLTSALNKSGGKSKKSAGNLPPDMAEKLINARQFKKWNMGLTRVAVALYYANTVEKQQQLPEPYRLKHKDLSEFIKPEYHVELLRLLQ